MRKAVPLLAGVVIGALAVVLGVLLTGKKIVPADYRPASTLPSPACDALVKVSLGKDSGGKPKIFANPDPVCLAIGRSLTWEVVDQPETKNASLEITFKDKGPFPQDLQNNPENLDVGYYKHTGPGRINSNKAEKNDRWIYRLKWTFTDATYVETADPVVCIRD